MADLHKEQALKDALTQANIPITKQDGKYFHLERAYIVEVEQNGIYKLTQQGKVIAPFADLQELCDFMLLDRSILCNLNK
ncbi:MAG: hypothetical protein AAGH79_15310 [Bacteroidota bacterium]